MFIPIDAKADVSGSKKGKLTPAQHAQLNAWCLSEKTGILDCLDKCEYNVSTTSLVPSNNKVTVKFKKGYLVICGRLVECEAETEVEITTPTTGTETGWIIAKYDLSSTENSEFVVTQKKTSQGALVQEDLNDNPISGVYEFPLYSYTATSSLVTLERTGSYIPDIGGKLEQFEEDLTSEGKPLYQYDSTKGTIEARLTALGFRQGSISSNATTTQTNVLKRQGNYIYGLLSASRNPSGGGSRNILPISVPSEFAPASAISFKTYVSLYYLAGQTYREEGSYATVTINTDGSFTFSNLGITNATITGVNLNFGYEANPIT